MTQPIAAAGGMMMDENSMLNMMKTKMMFDMVGALGVSQAGDANETGGWSGMIVKCLALMLVPMLIKLITEALGKLKKWFEENCMSRFSFGIIKDPDYNFKYEIKMCDNYYTTLVLSQTFNDENSKYRTRLLTSSESFNDQFFTEKKVTGVMQFLAQFGPYVVPIKDLKFGQYIYICRATDKSGIMTAMKIACNTRTQDLIDYLNDLDKRYKKVHENIKRKINIYADVDGTPKARQLKMSVEMDNVFCEKKEPLLQIVRQFQDVKWYSDRGLTHHLNILFKGEHGCGKTKMITAIACMLGKDLIMVDCATQLKTKKQLQDLLDNYGSTCIIVLEDFDRVPSALIVSNVLNASTSEEKGGSVTSSSSSNTATEKNTKEHLGRLFDAYANCPTGTANEEKRKELLKLYNDELKNRETNQDLDLSFLLNKLDGPQSQPGRMIFLTANHPERIESALRRPGRIDYEVEFSRASRETVAQILCRFFRDSLPTELMDAVSSLSSRYEKEEEDVTSENAILENETLSEEKVQKETGKGKEKGKEKEITKLTTFFDTVKDGKFTHSQIYAVCKKYNDLYKVVDELSQSHLDLSSVSL